MTSWPNDADGDVLRRLEESQFDFGTEHVVDFNIDFAQWPPSHQAIEQLKSHYPVVRVFEPEDKYPGYVLVQMSSFLTYEFVMQMQSKLTESMKEFGGICESWGVSH